MCGHPASTRNIPMADAGRWDDLSGCCYCEVYDIIVVEGADSKKAAFSVADGSHLGLDKLKLFCLTKMDEGSRTNDWPSCG